MHNTVSPNELKVIEQRNERQRKINKARRINIAKRILKLFYRYRYFYAFSIALFLIGFALATVYFDFDNQVAKASPNEQCQPIIMPTQLKTPSYSNPLPVTVSGNTESIEGESFIDLKLSRVLSLSSTTKE